MFNADPIRELVHLDNTKVGRVKLAQQLDRSNLIALASDKFDEKNIAIFDPFKKQFVWEFTLPKKVLGIRVKNGRLLGVCEDSVNVFEFPNRCRFLFSLNTR